MPNRFVSTIVEHPVHAQKGEQKNAFNERREYWVTYYGKRCVNMWTVCAQPGGSMSSPGAARLDGLQPSLKNLRQRFRQTAKLAFSLDLVTKISQHNHFRYFRHHFGSTFPRNPKKQCFAHFQRCRLCNDVFNILADEFGDFGAVFGTALKERNQTIGYKKHGGISAYRKAFLIIWRWIFEKKRRKYDLDCFLLPDLLGYWIL